MNDSDSLNRDSQSVASAEEAAAAQIDGRLKELHTAGPGIINSYDPETRTCSVQPAIKRVFNGVAVDLPLCVDCPVQFPEGGGFILTFPLQPGDEVLLVLAERAIDNWFAAGGTQEPAEYRMHDLSDGFAIAGIRNQTRNLAAISATDVELRNEDGSQRISLAPNGDISQVTGPASTVLGADGKFTVNAPGGFFVNGAQQNSSTLHAVGNISTDADVLAALISLLHHKHSMQLIQAGAVTKPTSESTP